MNIKLIHKLLTLFFLIISCGSDDDSNPNPEIKIEFPSVTDFNVEDLANEGNSTDLKIAFKLVGDITTVKESKLVVAKSSKALKIEDVSKLTGNQFVDFTPVISVSKQLSKVINDTDGDLIKEDVDYTAYIILSNGNQIVLNASEKVFQLKNETIVTTLVESIEANEDITLDSDLNLYVNGGANSSVTPKTVSTKIFKVTPEGAVSVFANTLNFPVGSIFDTNGNLFLTYAEPNVISKISKDGTVSEFVKDSRLFGGGSLVLRNDGTIINTFYSSKRIFKITMDGVVSILLTRDERLNGPETATYDAMNDIIYVANYNDGKIFKLGKDNILVEIADTESQIGQMSYANGHLYFGGHNNHQVFKVNVNGEIVETIGTGEKGHLDGTADKATFHIPNGIEVTPDGKIAYLTNFGEEPKIRKIILKR